MAEPVRAVDCIKRLSALGLQISIDDFGTGYSSMAYLRDLLVAKIKIDKSFVKDMAVNHSDAVIVRSTIELGHNLGLKVIAEGVETEAAWDRLKALGCDDAQGYYMSHPLASDKFAEWLQQSPWGIKRGSPSNMRWLINLAGVVVIGLIAWWFWRSRPKAQRVTGAGPIEILVENGVYTPARIEVPAGKTATLRFLRKDPSPCAEKVLFDTLGVSAELPLGKPVMVTVTPDKPGEVEFTCQMRMYRGTLVVR